MSHCRRLAGVGVVALALVTACGSPEAPAGEPPPAVEAAPLLLLAPAAATDLVGTDPDDPAIWIASDDPAASLVLATDKIEVEGGLYVFDLEGRTRQVIAPLDRPNNVDVEYGLVLGGEPVDVAVVTERMQHRLRVYAIPRGGGDLVDLAPGGVPVFAGEEGEAAEPMGIGLYKRPADGAVFAVVSRATGPTDGYLWQYRLEDDGQGGVRGALVRRFGAFSGLQPDPEAPGEFTGEIEALVVDDELGFIYYADELFGIRKYHADPDHPDAAIELAAFGTDGYLGDREGLAVVPTGPGTGYLVSSDQVEGATRLLLYPREGAGADLHAHVPLAVVPTPSDDTDGLDVTVTPLPGFRDGLLVMMNSGSRNFLYYRWDEVLAAAGLD